LHSLEINKNLFLQVAIEAAHLAGEYLLQNRKQLAPEHVEEKTKNSFVTFLDKGAEDIIIKHIKSHFQNHSILAEESGAQEGNHPIQWIIDPLDGTTNFIHDIPFYCVSIAAKYENNIIVGVVFDPVRSEMFASMENDGSFLNGSSIDIRSPKDFSKEIIATGFPHRAKRYLPFYLAAFQEIILKCSGVRRCGAAALDLCYTACGRYGGFWELGLSPWDMAAGSLIVKEAGGIITDFWGRGNYLENGFVIAANKQIQKPLQHILLYHFKSFKTQNDF
jgi:myo-inositol-1(or 4)-monophosphatase